MTEEVVLFRLDKERDELLREIADYLVAAPECADVREALEIVRRELDSLVHKLAKEFASIREELLKLLQELVGLLYEVGLDLYAVDLLKLCEKLSTYTFSIDLQRPEFRAVFLDSVRELVRYLSLSTYILYISIENKQLAEKLKEVCGKIEQHSSYRMLVRFLKLTEVEKTIKKIANYKEDYMTLRRLAAAYQLYRTPAVQSPVKVFNAAASECRASGLLRYLRVEINVGEVDLIEAFKHLGVLEEMLKEKLNIQDILELLAAKFNYWSRPCGTIPALAYVLTHVAIFVDLRELLRELVNYVEAVLADVNRVNSSRARKEKLENLPYSMVKILALILCLNGRVDWRLAAAFAISAAKNWARWDEESSFIDLCRGLRALHDYATREEAERILTYATLYGDYDLIVKLRSLLWARHSLSSVNPLR
ncbi:MAG: hypothetical protein QXT28_13040 [Thermofilaceae archaeon]